MILGIQSFIGIVDVLIILSFIVAILLGWFLGFFNKLLKIANWVCGILFAVIFCNKFASFLGLFFYDPLYNFYAKKIEGSEAFQTMTSEVGVKEGLKMVLTDIGIPKWIANICKNAINVEDVENVKQQIVYTISNSAARFILIIISFFVVLILTTIIFFILKRLIDKFRENQKFRYFDGVLGVIFYIVLDFCLVTILMSLVYLIATNSNTVYTFMNKDMRLESGRMIGIGRYFYNKNLIVKLFQFLF